MGDVILTLDNYSIYKNNGYYLCVSSKPVNNYQMFMGFSFKDLDKMSLDEVISEIKNVSESLFSRSSDVIYVLPIIDPLILERAANINDDKEYNRILNSFILPVTSDVYKKFTNNNKRINDVITMVKQNEFDQKIIHWIDMKLMQGGIDYIQEVDIKFLKNSRNLNEVAINPIFENPHNIFDFGIAPINREYEQFNQNKENKLVKKLVKTDDHPAGFSSMGFIIMVLGVLLVFSVIIVTLILK